MFFDLSQNVILNKNAQKNYLFLRTILYLAALLAAGYLIIAILFPSAEFSFSLLNPNSNKNSPLDPRDQNGNFPDQGKIPAKTDLIFDAPLAGNFSRVEVSLEAGNKIIDLSGQKISLKKSYRAFLYPESQPLGFKNGSLLKSNGNFYLIADQKARKFLSRDILAKLGYSPENFLEASLEELAFTPAGEDISDPNHYPNYTLFKIEANYYQLLNGSLEKFVSPGAFLSQYDDRQAIIKEKDFLTQLPLSKNQQGFSDGSLISYGEAVYLVSGTEVFPIDNPITFEKSGYVWEDVEAVSGDELYFYQKGKLFNIGKAHPAGTVFRTVENGKYYLIQGKTKHLLPSEKIAMTWFKKTPITVSEKGLSREKTCLLEKSSGEKLFSCEIPLEEFKDAPGKDYQFQLENPEETEIDSLNVVFKKAVNRENFRLAASEIINKIITNYARKN